MKPLTAEEIAEERENLRENGGDDAVGLPTNRLVRLLDEVERSRAEVPTLLTAEEVASVNPYLIRARALLERIEWNGNPTGEKVFTCPACGYSNRFGQGHEPGCELAALLGAP